MNKMKQLLLLLLAGWLPLTLQAQVNVGVDEDALPATIMQWKEVLNVTDSTRNAYHGLAFPRVLLSNATKLYPMFLANHDDPTSGDSEDYNSDPKKEILNKRYTGLVVYNLTNDATKGLSPGLAQWTGRKWVSLASSTAGAAIFAVPAHDDISVSGSYAVNTPVNSSNFLTLQLTVITPGSYTILAQSDNGYSFYVTGMALNAGTLRLTIPAQGTPILAQVDNLVFSGITPSGPATQVSVSAALANYSLNCSATKVNGNYQKGIMLDDTHTIEVGIIVNTPGAYSITTPEVKGICFSAKGTFSAADIGIKKVSLNGSGTPTVHTDIPLSITSNSIDGITSCNVTIPVATPKITYAVIGYNESALGIYLNYSWDYASTRRMALASANNFGTNPNSIVKVSNFTKLWATDNKSNAVNWINNGYSGEVPDIILYNTYQSYLNQNLAEALAAYVKKGGCLIFGASNDDLGTNLAQTNNLLQSIFGASCTAQAQAVGTIGGDNPYPIANLPNNPIINGPFGNLAGQYWGEDNAGNVVVPSIPSTSIQICSAHTLGKASVNPAHSIVWYDTVYNFFFIGDSSGSTNDPAYALGGIDFPALYVGGVPQSKLYGDLLTTQRYSYNAHLEMNAVAWAIKRALTGGINPHP